MERDIQAEQIREIQQDLLYLRRRLFGDAREASADSLAKTVEHNAQETQALKLELVRMRTWNIFLTGGFVIVVIILMVMVYLSIAGGIS